MNKRKSSELIDESDLKVYPIEQAETIPSAWYTEETIFNFELENIFNSSWQIIGHVNQLPNVGDYILFELLGNPLIIIKSDESNVQAFFNVCRHRGGPLVAEQGNTKLFQCKYHGWTYKLDGSLHKNPKFDDAENFDKIDFCLKSLQTIVL
jgi:choline monooxygenase